MSSPVNYWPFIISMSAPKILVVNVDTACSECITLTPEPRHSVPMAYALGHF